MQRGERQRGRNKATKGVAEEEQGRKEGRKNRRRKEREGKKKKSISHSNFSFLPYSP